MPAERLEVVGGEVVVGGRGWEGGWNVRRWSPVCGVRQRRVRVWLAAVLRAGPGLARSAERVGTVQRSPHCLIATLLALVLGGVVAPLPLSQRLD